MPKRLPDLFALTEDQRAASDPFAMAWVSASAGTGKTQVLTARVMRLLLAGVDPASILCLTFTKAGAAEMADRIHARLAYWVRLKDAALARELKALGSGHDLEMIARARKLFAGVLDATGGGLRIQTIHAFAQSLLASFPAEAGIVPGFRPLEGRAEAILARDTLAAMLIAAEAGKNGQLISDVQQLSRRLGEAGAESFLINCARRLDALEIAGPPELIEDRLRKSLDVPGGDLEAVLAAACAADVFDDIDLVQFAQANAAWGTKTGLQRADATAAWIASEPPARSENLAALQSLWTTKAGAFSQIGWKKLTEIDPQYEERLERIHDQISGLLALRIKAEFAAFAAAGLRSGSQFARDYAAAKRRAGVLDFNDMIRLTQDLLVQPGMGQWVRYKLDQRLDHILVDEAQDTNTEQWSIVAALASGFFEGDPEIPGEAAHRTIFAVGDFKQAIFGFQGTNPLAFRAARQIFDKQATDSQRDLQQISLNKSYRSAATILSFVDAVFEEIGADALGLDGILQAHESGREGLPGRVTLLRPVSAENGDTHAEEGWLPDPTLEMARKLAQQIKAWLDDGHWLAGKGRALRPEDILVLVRSRGELASLLVARLHAEGIPVAGVDRLMLTDPLAIQDLLAALRFATQPADDLSLANLLVSPLMGWTQDQLYGLAKGRKTSLWSMLQDKSDTSEEARNSYARINEIRNQLDYLTPYQLLEFILSGPIRGREKLLKRLGKEARDPIDELLNAALVFERDNPPSLQHFLDWFDRGDAEIKRDSNAPLDAVRVMTVHGAKGLQAPMVILADAAFDPDRKPTDTIDFELEEGKPPIPLPRPRKLERVDEIADAVSRREKADREEHWRLFYVALTRAEEHLVIGGKLELRATQGAPAASWYAAAERAMTRFSEQWDADPLWTESLRYEGQVTPGKLRKTTARANQQAPLLATPDWLFSAAKAEPRPSRPLAPSALGDDQAPNPPPTKADAAAMERGIILHRLFERLPAIAPADRQLAAVRWLAHSAGIAERQEREAIAREAIAVIEDSQFAPIFANGSLAEAPIAAVVDGLVVSGTVDRLLIGDDKIQVVDFKTGRFVPDSEADVPLTHVRQMSAYCAALAAIFPNREIEAALLYTGSPRIIHLSQQVLDQQKPGLPIAE
jgi:ATP-dependent helicase/nuclease subunit A